jgi:CDP-2,3-bis-(O-geranylgeranyl)-sn-glycerol synthase
MADNLLIDALIIFLQGFWLMIPAYMTGPFAVLFGGKDPIDRGKKHKDGRRILGDGKTVSGFFFGILGGMAIGSLQSLGVNYYGAEAHEYFTDFTPGDMLSACGFMGVVFAMCLGAMIGDLIASYVKRRKGLKRGKAAPIVDQLDFVVGAWIFVIIFYPSWVFANFTWTHALSIAITTPLMHLVSNFIGYKLGKKKEPW